MNRNATWRRSALLGLAATVALSTLAAAQQRKTFVFPAKGQSPRQQAADEKACHDWSVLQVGFDPQRNPPPPPPDLNAIAAAPTMAEKTAPPKPSKSDQRKARRRGALRGAARGAAVGEISGGKWEDGAMVGAAGGAVRSSQAQKQQANAQAQAQRQASDAEVQGRIDSAIQAHQIAMAQWNTKNNDYSRARTACLQAKGYTVQ